MFNPAAQYNAYQKSLSNLQVSEETEFRDSNSLEFAEKRKITEGDIDRLVKDLNQA